jgi:hypothetical protein
MINRDVGLEILLDLDGVAFAVDGEGQIYRQV